MKVFKKIAAIAMAVAMVFTLAISSMSVSAAGFASQMLNANQRKFYDALVQKYVTDFETATPTSFSFWFRDQLEFDTSEGDVTTEELFMAAAMFVADYSAFLPWLDMEGIALEGYDSPFVAAVADPVLFGDDDDPTNDMQLNLAVVMFAIKDEWAGETADLFGYPNTSIVIPRDDSVESDNLALAGTVSAESTALDAGSGLPRGDLATELANDGDYTTRWQSQIELKNAPTWFAVDLGEAKTFDRLRIYWENARANADGYTVQVSNDGEDWTDATVSVSRQDDYMVGATKTFYDQVSFVDPQTAQYVRINMTAGNDKGGPSIYEFEVYNGEPAAAPATLTGIEITKAPDNTEFYVGTYPIPDLTGMELTLHYSDDSTDVLNDEQLKELQGVGSADVVYAAVDVVTQSLFVQYLGFETSTPITMTAASPVASIEVVTEPTGEGLQGLVLNAVTTEGDMAVEVAADAEPQLAIDMMGYSVTVYAVECDLGTYLLMGLGTSPVATTITFMGAATTIQHSFTDTVSVSNGTDLFVATNIAEADVEAGKVIKADYVITRDGNPVEDSVIITNAWSSVTLGEVVLTSADFDGGRDGDYVTGVLFKNVGANDEIEVTFSIVDAE